MLAIQSFFLIILAFIASINAQSSSQPPTTISAPSSAPLPPSAVPTAVPGKGVSAPRAGQIIIAGTSFTIEWGSLEGLTVQIGLYIIDFPESLGLRKRQTLPGTYIEVGFIANDEANDGSYVWDVPAALPAGTNYVLGLFGRDAAGVVVGTIVSDPFAIVSGLDGADDGVNTITIININTVLTITDITINITNIFGGYYCGVCAEKNTPPTLPPCDVISPPVCPPVTYTPHCPVCTATTTSVLPTGTVIPDVKSSSAVTTVTPAPECTSCVTKPVVPPAQSSSAPLPESAASFGTSFNAILLLSMAPIAMVLYL